MKITKRQLRQIIKEERQKLLRSPAKAPVSEAGKPLPPDPGPYQQDPEAPFELDPGGDWDKYWADDKKAEKGSVTGTYHEQGYEDALARRKHRYDGASDAGTMTQYREYLRGYDEALDNLDDEEERRMSRWDDHYDELEAGQQNEGKKIRITKRQLRQIIAEQMALVPVETLDSDQPAIIGDGGDASMARGQLFNIARKAQSLQDKLSDEDQLPEWVQSKIAVMADNMDAVADYLGYELHKEEINEAYIPVEIDIKTITDQTGIITIDSRSAEEIGFKLAECYDVVNDLNVLLESSLKSGTIDSRLDPRLAGLMNQLDKADDSLYDAQMSANHIAQGTGG